MKKVIYLILLALTTSSYAQTKMCDCSDALNRDLVSIVQKSDYRKLKEFLYVYFKSDATTQSSMKNDKSYSWSSSAEAVIEAIPVKGTGNAGISSSEESQIYNRLEQTYSKNSYLSDEQVNELFTTTMSDAQLQAYKACLNQCGNVIGKGLTSNVSGDAGEIFSIQINFKSIPSGADITLRGDATFPNLEPIGPLVFKNGTVLKDGGSLLQYFKKVDPTKSASFSFNVIQPGVVVTPLDFPAVPKINTEKIPIGTIVASILNYKNFLESNGFPETGDMSQAIWVPCDGRIVSTSQYNKFGNIPDLRGLFLRSINDCGVTYTGVVAVDPSHANPDNNTAGQIQQDAFQKHNHKINMAQGPFGPDFANMPNVGQGDSRPSGVPQAENSIVIRNAGTESETRPKNMTVYYYIKIN